MKPRFRPMMNTFWNVLFKARSARVLNSMLRLGLSGPLGRVVSTGALDRDALFCVAIKAFAHRNASLLEKAMEQGVDLGVRTPDGNTFLHLAVLDCQCRPREDVGKTLPLMRLLLGYGMDMDVCDIKGQSAWDCAQVAPAPIRDLFLAFRAQRARKELNEATLAVVRSPSVRRL